MDNKWSAFNYTCAHATAVHDAHTNTPKPRATDTPSHAHGTHAHSPTLMPPPTQGEHAAQEPSGDGGDGRQATITATA
jgi:hypothetical protein